MDVLSMVTASGPMVNGTSVLAAFGALGVLIVLFAESGLLVVGFFLPGDTLLFPAGVLCGTGQRSGPHLVLWQVLLCAAVGAVAGAQLGFWIGRHSGRALLSRGGNRQVKRWVARSEELLTRYGVRRAIVLSRFVPMARTVVSPLAGALEVPVRTFTLWQTVGSLVWSQGLVLAGYVLGASVPGVERYLLPIVAAVVAVSLLPLVVQLWQARRSGSGSR
ncbi:DedA family protein [Streptacidiphilus sp. N1-12]|uniref:DedA family protein n=2 Tax=Streptacidiphilus alkalitolerans TaxID=3342712 RepID=A0ABV6WMJ5_9ACTN